MADTTHAVQQVTDQNFESVVNGGKPVLVDFWAPWCGPCRMVSPVIEKMGREYAGRLKVVKLDIDPAPAIASRYGVQGIPLLMVIRDGREIDRLVGAVAPDTLRTMIDQHVSAAARGG